MRTQEKWTSTTSEYCYAVHASLRSASVLACVWCHTDSLNLSWFQSTPLECLVLMTFLTYISSQSPLLLTCDLVHCSAVTENTRASYPIHYINNARIPCVGSHPKNLILLCCDAFGVLPPVSKLTKEQAMYHFISGYTAKVPRPTAALHLSASLPTLQQYQFLDNCVSILKCLLCICDQADHYNHA